MKERDGNRPSISSTYDLLSGTARSILPPPLHTVYALAPLASHFGLEHPEYIHRLRVATRRSHVALRAFTPVLPRKRTQRWIDDLRKLRRIAGPARDLDVILTRWESATEQEPLDQELNRRLRILRSKRQIELRHQLAEYRWDRYPRKLDAFVRRIHWRGRGAEPTWGAAARNALDLPMEEYLRAGRDLAGSSPSPPDVNRLHRLRILGKRIRYELELCESVFDSEPYRNLLRRLTTLQQRLGQINDLAVGIRWLRFWMQKDSFRDVRPALRRWREQDRATLNLEISRLILQSTQESWDQLANDWRILPSRPEPYPNTRTRQI